VYKKGMPEAVYRFLVAGAAPNRVGPAFYCSEKWPDGQLPASGKA